MRLTDCNTTNNTHLIDPEHKVRLERLSERSRPVAVVSHPHKVQFIFKIRDLSVWPNLTMNGLVLGIWGFFCSEEAVGA